MATTTNRQSSPLGNGRPNVAPLSERLRRIELLIQQTTDKKILRILYRAQNAERLGAAVSREFQISDCPELRASDRASVSAPSPHIPVAEIELEHQATSVLGSSFSGVA